MNTNFQNKIRIFEDYLRGNLSKKDETALADWINTSDENYQLFKKYIAENQFSQSCSGETVVAWQKLKSKIDCDISSHESRKIIIPNWLKVAAIITIAILSGFFANQLIRKDQYSSILNEVIIPNGEKAQLVLSDGTKVFLNAGTHFKYPAVFSKKSRKVIMTGEAFFEVTKDKANPFIIETPEFDVKVTGTSFNLKTYTDDEMNSLTLHTGELTIANEGREFKIHPGEKYILNTQTNESNIDKADLQKSKLWTTGVIVLDNLDLDEIGKILERKFDVQIQFSDEKYKKISYNGQFKPYENLTEILDMIKETSPIKFNYEINEAKDKVTIK